MIVTDVKLELESTNNDVTKEFRVAFFLKIDFVVHVDKTSFYSSKQSNNGSIQIASMAEEFQRCSVNDIDGKE